MKKPSKVTPAYRIAITCSIGRDAIENNKAPCGRTPTEYALYTLLLAVGDMARMIEQTTARAEKAGGGQ